MMRSIEGWSSFLLFPCLVVLSGCAPTAGNREAVTFNRDVAPILFSRCAPCHRPGQATPFTLLSYEDARRRARDIARVAAAKRMPPWLPDPSDPAFLDERRLSSSEIETVRRWVEADVPEGNGADLPSAPSWPSGWALGTPDLVATLERPFTLQPGYACGAPCRHPHRSHGRIPTSRRPGRSARI